MIDTLSDLIMLIAFDLLVDVEIVPEFVMVCSTPSVNIVFPATALVVPS